MGLHHEDDIDVTNITYTIDPDTRTISGSTSKKNEIVQYDHDSERIQFTLPRYIDGHDMSLSDRVTVQYMNEDTYGSYIVDDLTISDDNESVVFSWLIGNRATQNDGNLVFAVNFRCFDSSGNVVYNWSTQPGSLILVLKGLFDTEDSIDAEFKDLLASLELRLNGLTSEGVLSLDDLKETTIDELETDDKTVIGSLNELIRKVNGSSDECVKIISLAENKILTPIDSKVTIPIATLTDLGLVKGSDEINQISVGTYGEMIINQISIDKLAQDSDELLVLESGSSTTNF